jgi:hypothetical protein
MGGIVNTLGGLVGGLGSSLAESSGATSDFNAQLDPQALAQQQAFVQALQQQMSGQGPNLAQEQLRQATSANQAMAAGMAASQKGISPATAARLALQNQAAMQQQAAGQSGTLRAQQQLQTQGLMGQQLAQQQAQTLQAQGINAQTEAQNAATRGQIVGGMLSAAGAAGAAFAPKAVPKAEGGMIERPEYQSLIARHIMGLPAYQPMANGAMVPGHAKVDGDSYQNDTVSAILSPGEIVIPRSIALSKNAPEEAKKFVADTVKKKGNLKEQYADGGQIPDYLTSNADYFQKSFTPGADILGETMRGAVAQAPTKADKFNEQVQYVADITGADLNDPAERDKIQKGVVKDLKIKQYEQTLAEQRAAGIAQQEAAEKQKLEQAKAELLGMPAKQAVQPMAIQAPPVAAGISPDLAQYTTALDAMKKGISEQEKGLTGQAKVMGQIGETQAELLRKQNEDMLEKQQEFTKSTADLNERIKSTNEELAAAKIDPNKYLGDLSTVGKISTTIGLILGGIGGGMQKTGRNVAMDVLNQNIDRDIQAQKANLDSKNTLLSGYYKELGNMRDAYNMTKATMLEQTANELKAVALDKQGTIEGYRAQQAIGAIKFQTAELVGKTAANKAFAATPSAQTPEAQLERVRQINPEQAKALEARLVPGVGFAAVPVPDTARQKMAARQSLNETLNKLQKFAKQNEGSLSAEKNAEGESLAKQAWDSYRLANEMGAFTGDEKQFVEDIVGGSPTKFFANFRTLPKYKAAQSQNQSILNNMYKSYGLTPKKDLSAFEGKVGR